MATAISGRGRRTRRGRDQRIAPRTSHPRAFAETPTALNQASADQDAFAPRWTPELGSRYEYATALSSRRNPRSERHGARSSSQTSRRSAGRPRGGRAPPEPTPIRLSSRDRERTPGRRSSCTGRGSRRERVTARPGHEHCDKPPTSSPSHRLNDREIEKQAQPRRQTAPAP